MISLVLCCAVSYLLGSIPNGLIIGKVIWGIDLREYGSKNIGATNGVQLARLLAYLFFC